MGNKKFSKSEMSSSNPIVYNKKKCIGCNKCIEICQVDILIPNPNKGEHPLVMFTDECWFCGCCVLESPTDGAITLRHPLMNRVHWVTKDSFKKKL